MSWVRYAAERVLVSVVLLFLISIAIFAIVRLLPGDPAQIMAGQSGDPQAIEQVRQQLGLDKPVWVQYIDWISDLVAGDWGQSFMSGISIYKLISTRYPRSLELAVVSIIISISIALPLAIKAATQHNGVIDSVIILISQVGLSMPSFWLGIILILTVSSRLGLLPPSGYVPYKDGVVQHLRHLALPALTLGIINGATLIRYIRSEFIEELNKDYVRTAKAYGHPNRRIVWKYVMRNALIPTLTMVGIILGYTIGGVVIVELVFSYAGLGLLILDSLFIRDYPTFQIGLLVLAATFLAINLIVDLLYGYLDPKIRY